MQPALTLRSRFSLPLPVLAPARSCCCYHVLGVSIIARLPEAVELFEEVLRSVDEKKRTEIMRSRFEVWSGIHKVRSLCSGGRLCVQYFFLRGRLLSFWCNETDYTC